MREAALALERATMDAPRRPDLGEQKRELVYPFGAAQFMLLDACGSGWRKRYPDVLALTPLLDAALVDCRHGATAPHRGVAALSSP